MKRILFGLLLVGACVAFNGCKEETNEEKLNRKAEEVKAEASNALDNLGK